MGPRRRSAHPAYTWVVISNLLPPVNNQRAVQFYNVRVVVSEFVTRSITADNYVLRHMDPFRCLFAHKVLPPHALRNLIRIFVQARHGTKGTVPIRVAASSSHSKRFRCSAGLTKHAAPAQNLPAPFSARKTAQCYRKLAIPK